MADDLATDPQYVEACRVAAWAERPAVETDRHWDAATRKYRFPDGWPEGVQPDAYVQQAIVSAAPATATDTLPPADSASPSVRRLREMLR